MFFSAFNKLDALRTHIDEAWRRHKTVPWVRGVLACVATALGYLGLHRFAAILDPQSGQTPDIILAHIRATRRKYADGRLLIRSGLTGTAILLGFIGFGGIAALSPFHLQGILDAWYKIGGLLTIHLPRQLEDGTNPIPATIQIARFLLPTMAIWLSIVAYLRIFRIRMRFFRLFLPLTGHVIVVGPGPRAIHVAQLCRAYDPGGKLVYITDHEDDAALADLHALGIMVLRGDSGLTETYIRADLKNASAIVLVGDKVMANVRACAAVRSVALERRSSDLAALSLVVAIDGPDMGTLLDGTFHEARDRRIEYRLLDPMDNVAQGLVKRLFSLLGSPDRMPAVLMIGWSGPAPAIFHRVLRNGPPGLQLIVADRGAELVKASLLAATPDLAELSGLHFLTTDASSDVLANAALVDVLSSVSVGAIVICGDTDESNFRTAIQLRRHARTHSLWTPPIYLRQQGNDVPIEALKQLVGAETIDVSRIHPFGSLDEQFAAEFILVGREEKLAKAVHDDYCKGKKPADNTMPWESLRETFRISNRLQAEHIDVKLAAARCRRVPKAGASQGVPFSWDEKTEIKQLAILEHWRWCVDRWLDGWMFAPQRQDTARKHNLLVPYDQLTEEIQGYDKDAVRNIPALVDLAECAIQRESLVPVTPAHLAAVDPAEAIEAELRQLRQQERYPVVIFTVANKTELALCRKLQDRGISVRITMTEPYAAMAARVTEKNDLIAVVQKDLIAALDAADDVIPPVIPAEAAELVKDATPAPASPLTAESA